MNESGSQRSKCLCKPCTDGVNDGQIGTKIQIAGHRQWSYANLKSAPCRYRGSTYLDTLILCGHNYRSHFGKLKKLREGDEVSFTDMDGNVFLYEVALVETLMPAAIEEMESGGWALTMFNCFD
ncbi:MAG: sortase [Eubacteriales bacterium]|nr:sortase [Eubacteriales bacterium]